MSNTVSTHVTMLVQNEVSDEDAEQLIEQKNVDSLDDVAEGMEDDVRSILVNRVFGDADTIAICDVNTEVESDE